MNDKQLSITRRQLTGLLAALTIDYLLGVTLTTVISYDPNKHSTTQNIFLGAHILVAAGILIGAVVRLVMSIKWQSMQLLSGIGLVSVLISLAAGDYAAQKGSNLAVLLMAIFFIVAMLTYGFSFTKIYKNSQNL
jgi:hypothetical protein